MSHLLNISRVLITLIAVATFTLYNNHVHIHHNMYTSMCMYVHVHVQYNTYCTIYYTCMYTVL